MTKIIPRRLIQHLELVPGQELPERNNPISEPQIIPALNGKFDINALIKEGKPFYSNEKDSKGNYIGVAVSLEQALTHAGVDGIVASMPHFIAGKAIADKKTYLWKDWFTALSEEDVGIDKNGSLVTAGSPVVITVHGGGILTPERIRQAYAEGLTGQNAARYAEHEFDNLLKGVLPDGTSIQIYTLEDIKKGSIPDPFGRYAVALDFEVAKATSSGYHKKEGFMNNPLVLVRAGTLECLEEYFDKAKDSDGDVGNHHRLGEIDPHQAQGRVLFVDFDHNGLGGSYYLDGIGRFVRVGAGGAGAPK